MAQGCMSGYGSKCFGANILKRVSCVRDPIVDAFELKCLGTVVVGRVDVFKGEVSCL